MEDDGGDEDVNYEFPLGVTVGGGLFLVTHWVRHSISGGRLSGIGRRTGEPVHISFVHGTTKTVEELRARMGYQLPGVATCLFIGGVDGQHDWPHDAHESAFVVEKWGTGKDLSEVNPGLTSRARLHIAKQVARSVSRATQHRVVLGGIHPDLITLDHLPDPTATLAPRFVMLVNAAQRRVFVGRPPSPFSSAGAFFDPMCNAWLASPATDVYCLGLLISWLFTNKHPFADFALRSDDGIVEAMTNDDRDPFTGPPAIGKLLDQVIVADEHRRMPIDAVVSALDDVVLDPDG